MKRASSFDAGAFPGPASHCSKPPPPKKDPNSPAAVDTATSDRGPLLITGGAKDHQVPEAVTRAAYHLYAGSRTITDYHVFPDRGHSLVFDSGWREVADFTLAWLGRH
jgi:non-heme chloroperoxidase